MTESTQLRIPLILGVTGHRDIDPALLDTAKMLVRQLFTQLNQDYPDTPLVLLSPLVSCVDRLVAEVALEPDCRVALVAVRPWAAQYELTGDGPCGAADTLLARATQTIAMPLAAGVTAEGIAGDETVKQVQHDQVGRYIARHSQLLIAIWDGVDSAESHTAKMVRWFREGAPAPFTVRSRELDVGIRAAIWHLIVRRSPHSAAHHNHASGVPEVMANSVPAITNPSLQLQPLWEFPELVERSYVRKLPKKLLLRIAFHVRTSLLAIHHRIHAWTHRAEASSFKSLGERAIAQRWQAIDRFNRDIAELPQQYAAKLVESRNYLLPDKIADSLDPCLRRLREIYALADTSAGNWQRTCGRIVFGLFGMALLAVACLETYAHFVHETYFLITYLVLLAGGYSLFRWTRRHEHQGRWLDYRALAEALRVQIFWRWAGLYDCVADHYLRHLRGELDWIRHAARAAFLVSGGHSNLSSPLPLLVASDGIASAEQPDVLSLIGRHWVKDQRDFFQGKSPYNSELELSYETAARLAFFGAVAVALFHVFYHLGTHHMSHALVLTTFGCLVLTAFLEEYADIQAYTLLARRYRWMADLYENALNVLNTARSGPESDEQKAERARGVLFELGKEALTENADWVVQHRQRPPVLPSG